MYCKSCGKIVDDDSKFCMHCGAKLLSKDKIIPEIEIPVNPLNVSKKEIEPGNKFKTKPLITSFQKAEVENATENNTHLLEEFEVKETGRNLSPRDSFGYLFGIAGSFLLAWVIAFSLLNEHAMNESYGAGIGPFSLEKYSQLVYSIIFLLIGSFLLGRNRIILKKIISIAIDGIILFVWTALCVGIFLGNSSINDTSIFGYNLILNEFTTRIIAWSLFFLFYYLLGELTGGTFGKKIAGLVTLDYQKNRISLKQGFQKTLIYSSSILIILLWFVWNHYLINISDSILFHFCQWLCFALLFASLIMIFVSKEHHSLADIFSKTIVEKKSHQIANTNVSNVHTSLNEYSEIPNSEIVNISELHDLIAKEKKKFFPTQNELIIEKLEGLLNDKISFFKLNRIYKERFMKEIPEHLISISSANGTIYYYIEPLIRIGVCEKDFPYKIISKEI